MGLARLLTAPRKVATAAAPPAPVETRSLAEFGTQFLNSQGYWGSHQLHGVMGIPAVNRCVTLLGSLFGSAPLLAYREDRTTAKRTRIIPTPLMLDDPAGGLDTYVTVMSNWGTDLLLNGNMIGICVSRDADGWPSAWLPVPACAVGVRYMDTETYGIPVLGGMREYSVGGRTFPQWDILHVKAIHQISELRGLGVLEAAMAAFDRAHELDRQAGGVAYSGVPTGVLQTMPNASITDPSQLREAKEAWLDAQDTRTIAALAPGMEFKPISWNPEQMQLVEARKFSDMQIAQLFGVPLRYLGHDTGGLTYSTPGADSQTLLSYTLNLWLPRIEQGFTQHMPRAQFAFFERKAFLSIDPTTRFELHQSALQNRWMTVNEVRDVEDLPPVDWGNDPNYSTISKTEAVSEATSTSTSFNPDSVTVAEKQIEATKDQAAETPEPPADPPAEPDAENDEPAEEGEADE